MKQRSAWELSAQLSIVLLCALGLKLYYSTASANQLRWILVPTKTLVEWMSGTSFQFESYAGYISSNRDFLIAASCAGVNFLITAFLMLSLGRMWRNRSQRLSWSFIPTAMVFAYLATLAANMVRISLALRLQGMSLGGAWLSQNQLHRVEGISIYFGFLLLLSVFADRIGRQGAKEGFKGPTPGLLRQSLCRSQFTTSQHWEFLWQTAPIAGAPSFGSTCSSLY